MGQNPTDSADGGKLVARWECKDFTVSLWQGGPIPCPHSSGVYVFATDLEGVELSNWGEGLVLGETQPGRQPRWYAIYVGEAQNLAEELADLSRHGHWIQARKHGVSHVHWRVEEDPIYRGRTLEELQRRLVPPLNRKPQPNESFQKLDVVPLDRKSDLLESLLTAQEMIYILDPRDGYSDLKWVVIALHSATQVVMSECLDEIQENLDLKGVSKKDAADGEISVHSVSNRSPLSRPADLDNFLTLYRKIKECETELAFDLKPHHDEATCNINKFRNHYTHLKGGKQDLSALPVINACIDCLDIIQLALSSGNLRSWVERDPEYIHSLQESAQVIREYLSSIQKDLNASLHNPQREMNGLGVDDS